MASIRPPSAPAQPRSGPGSGPGPGLGSPNSGSAPIPMSWSNTQSAAPPPGSYNSASAYGDYPAAWDALEYGQQYGHARLNPGRLPRTPQGITPPELFPPSARDQSPANSNSPAQYGFPPPLAGTAGAGNASSQGQANRSSGDNGASRPRGPSGSTSATAVPTATAYAGMTMPYSHPASPPPPTMRHFSASGPVSGPTPGRVMSGPEAFQNTAMQWRQQQADAGRARTPSGAEREKMGAGTGGVGQYRDVSVERNARGQARQDGRSYHQMQPQTQFRSASQPPAMSAAHQQLYSPPVKPASPAIPQGFGSPKIPQGHGSPVIPQGSASPKIPQGFGAPMTAGKQSAPSPQPPSAGPSHGPPLKPAPAQTTGSPGLSYAPPVSAPQGHIVSAYQPLATLPSQAPPQPFRAASSPQIQPPSIPRHSRTPSNETVRSSTQIPTHQAMNSTIPSAPLPPSLAMPSRPAYQTQNSMQQRSQSPLQFAMPAPPSFQAPPSTIAPVRSQSPGLARASIPQLAHHEPPIPIPAPAQASPVRHSSPGHAKRISSDSQISLTNPITPQTSTPTQVAAAQQRQSLLHPPGPNPSAKQRWPQANPTPTPPPPEYSKLPPTISQESERTASPISRLTRVIFQPAPAVDSNDPARVLRASEIPPFTGSSASLGTGSGSVSGTGPIAPESVTSPYKALAQKMSNEHRANKAAQHIMRLQAAEKARVALLNLAEADSLTVSSSSGSPRIDNASPVLGGAIGNAAGWTIDTARADPPHASHGPQPPAPQATQELPSVKSSVEALASFEWSAPLEELSSLRSPVEADVREWSIAAGNGREVDNIQSQWVQSQARDKSDDLLNQQKTPTQESNSHTNEAAAVATELSSASESPLQFDNTLRPQDDANQLPASLRLSYEPSNTGFDLSSLLGPKFASSPPTSSKASTPQAATSPPSLARALSTSSVVDDNADDGEFNEIRSRIGSRADYVLPEEVAPTVDQTTSHSFGMQSHEGAADELDDQSIVMSIAVTSPDTEADDPHAEAVAKTETKPESEGVAEQDVEPACSDAQSELESESNIAVSDLSQSTTYDEAEGEDFNGNDIHHMEPPQRHESQHDDHPRLSESMTSSEISPQSRAEEFPLPPPSQSRTPLSSIDTQSISSFVSSPAHTPQPTPQMAEVVQVARPVAVGSPTAVDITPSQSPMQSPDKLTSANNLSGAAKAAALEAVASPAAASEQPNASSPPPAPVLQDIPLPANVVELPSERDPVELEGSMFSGLHRLRTRLSQRVPQRQSMMTQPPVAVLLGGSTAPSTASAPLAEPTAAPAPSPAQAPSAYTYTSGPSSPVPASPAATPSEYSNANNKPRAQSLTTATTAGMTPSPRQVFLPNASDLGGLAIIDDPTYLNNKTGRFGQRRVTLPSQPPATQQLQQYSAESTLPPFRHTVTPPFPDNRIELSASPSVIHHQHPRSNGSANRHSQVPPLLRSAYQHPSDRSVHQTLMEEEGESWGATAAPPSVQMPWPTELQQQQQLQQRPASHGQSASSSGGASWQTSSPPPAQQNPMPLEPAGDGRANRSSIMGGQWRGNFLRRFT